MFHSGGGGGEGRILSRKFGWFVLLFPINIFSCPRPELVEF